jgi:serine/threonine protein kinase
MGLETWKSPLQAVGDYDLLEKIAEGGMGAIYRARSRTGNAALGIEAGQTVAVKVMPLHMAQNTVLVKRFEQEFRAARQLDHPNIVRALDFGEHASMPYLVMEFVEGESLGQRLERDGPLPENDAIRVIAQVAQGLHRAHKQNLVHRDVKPDNILITTDGVAKLADLGLVKETETDLNLTRTGRGLGTPHFMAPEQFRNAKNADVRCDIYSLGATLYQMVTGELPFKSNGPLDAWMKKIQNELTPPRQVNPALSERIDWAILRAMSADPNMRPVSCREFVEDLTGHSTRRVQTLTAGQLADVWYLVYKDEEGVSHTVRGNTAAIRRSLKDGLLGDASNIRASRNKMGPFEPLRGYPEFRDLVVMAAPLTVPSPAGPTPPPPYKEPTADAVRGRLPGVITVGPASEAADQSVPRINLPTSGGAGEWVKWALLFVLVAASAGLAFWFLLPLLPR